MFHLLIILICIFIAIKTLAYAIWVFRAKNIIGGIAVAALAVLSLAPCFIVFA